METREEGRERLIGDTRWDDIRARFYAGNLEATRAWAESPAGVSLEAVPWIVGSLAHAGSIPEAELLYVRSGPTLTPAAHLRTLFYLMYACAQRGRYADARRFVLRMHRYRREATDATSRMHVRLAIGWLRFSTGRLRQAMLHGEAAYNLLALAACPYLEFVAADLVGHTRCLMGDQRRGLPVLRLAYEAARRLGRQVALPRLAVSIALHRSRWSEGGIEAEELDRLREQCRDGALAVSLALEAARRYAEDGALTQAQASLKIAAQRLAGAHSRRFAAALLVRQADLALASGDPATATLWLESARRWLDSQVDGAVEVEVVHRLLVAAERRGAPEETRVVLQQEVDQLTARTGAFVTTAPEMALAEPSSVEAAPVVVSPARLAACNDRQISLLRAMRRGDWIDVQTYRQRFDVSLITACRDLSALAKAGLLRRHGKARATKYQLGRVVSSSMLES